MSARPTLYRGSVKDVQGPFTLQTPRGTETCAVFHFTDAFSVFDWGKMPDALDGKGEALALLSAWFFEKLESSAQWKEFSKSEPAMALRKHIAHLPQQGKATLSLGAALGEIGETLQREGLRTHYVGLEDVNGKLVSFDSLAQPTRKLVVRRVHVERPEERSVLGRPIIDYSTQARASLPRLIPLEVVFRYGTPKGSSFLARVRDRPDYLESLPVPRTLSSTQVQEGTRFEFPILEPFTKLEATDRLLAFPEAFQISALSADQFQLLLLKTYWVAAFLKWQFAAVGVELLDGKLEWALGEQGEIVLVDAIGPDELRLEAHGVALSKEFLRAYYRKHPWHDAIERAKKQAKDTGRTEWKKLVQAQPPALPALLKDTATQIYLALAERMSKRKFWKSTGTFEDLITRLKTHGDFSSSPLIYKKGKTALVLGSGGREHAIAWKLAQSPSVGRLIVAPGNDGMLGIGERWEFSPGPDPQKAFEKLGLRAREEKVDLVVVGPDQLLADGVADALEKFGLKVFGPKRAAARMEWSKSFCKEVMQAAGVPTPQYRGFSTSAEAKQYLRSVKWNGWVVKADGLALGKGVEVCETLSAAEDAVDRLLPISGSIVIEERITGEEVSWMAFADGEACSLLEPARDFKRAHDGDAGPNTGGMGAYSPVIECLTPKLIEKVRQKVFLPTLRELVKRGIRYQGLLYAGLMFDRKNESFNVLEFNARFGDPEAQVLLPRFEGDLYYWMEAVASGRLDALPTQAPFRKESAVVVVAAAEGYPVKPVLGDAIEGLATPAALEAAPRFFAAGVKREGDQLFVNGGRVLGALGLGATLSKAREAAYASLAGLRFRGQQFRKDIAR